MGKDSTRQGVLFKGLSKKALVARFDQQHASSDGGAVLLKACDNRLGLSAAMAACLRIIGQPRRIVAVSITTGDTEQPLLKNLLIRMLNLRLLTIVVQARRHRST